MEPGQRRSFQGCFQSERHKQSQYHQTHEQGTSLEDVNGRPLCGFRMLVKSQRYAGGDMIRTPMKGEMSIDEESDQRHIQSFWSKIRSFFFFFLILQRFLQGKNKCLAYRRRIVFKPSILLFENCSADVLQASTFKPGRETHTIQPFRFTVPSAPTSQPAAQTKHQAWLQWNRRMNINSETLRPAAQRLWERNQNLNFILREAVGIVVFKKRKQLLPSFAFLL